MKNIDLNLRPKSFRKIDEILLYMEKLLKKYAAYKLYLFFNFIFVYKTINAMKLLLKEMKNYQLMIYNH